MHFLLITFGPLYITDTWNRMWWRHYIETLSALLALYEGNPGESQKGLECEDAVVRLNKLLKNQTSCCWIIDAIALMWRHCCVILYNDVIMGAIASQITSLTIVYSAVYSDADKRKLQSSASMAFLRGIYRDLRRHRAHYDDIVMKQWPCVFCPQCVKCDFCYEFHISHPLPKHAPLSYSLSDI